MELEPGNAIYCHNRGYCYRNKVPHTATAAAICSRTGLLSHPKYGATPRRCLATATQSFRNKVLDTPILLPPKGPLSMTRTQTPLSPAADASSCAVRRLLGAVSSCLLVDIIHIPEQYPRNNDELFQITPISILRTALYFGGGGEGRGIAHYPPSPLTGSDYAPNHLPPPSPPLPPPLTAGRLRGGGCIFWLYIQPPPLTAGRLRGGGGGLRAGHREQPVQRHRLQQPRFRLAVRAAPNPRDSDAR